MNAPLIVGIGGTPKPGSSTEQALAIALAAAAAKGARVRLFGGQYLSRLPLYLAAGYDGAADEMIADVRAADGLIVASPGYHGGMSGAVKNALDYLEETARDTRPYLDGLPVGLIVTAYGGQATGVTLSAMRAVVHALRGWPTPFGAAINTSTGVLKDGAATDPTVHQQLTLVGEQVLGFARTSAATFSAVAQPAA